MLPSRRTDDEVLAVFENIAKAIHNTTKTYFNPKVGVQERDESVIRSYWHKKPNGTDAGQLPRTPEAITDDLILLEKASKKVDFVEPRWCDQKWNGLHYDEEEVYIQRCHSD